ncbi:MAG: GNAT family N-acetyltransferase [Shimia sp.]
MIRPATPQDADAITQGHQRLYAGEYGFDRTFDETVATILADFFASPGRGAGWVLEDAGAVAGSIFCMEDGASRARLRLFYLDAEQRGRGQGRALLERCLAMPATRVSPR